MRANRSTLAKLCLLTALAVPVGRATANSSPKIGVASAQNQSAIASQLLAQADAEETPEFALPDSLSADDTLIIDGSTSMRSISDALTEQFVDRYPDATVEQEYSGSDSAISQLFDGAIDIAAIGRPLTDGEIADGLSAINISREKIAIIVGPDNPFEGDITFEQFAGIFRGEITDWSELGGEPGPIRFVDRPESSDTRKAFQSYPVFEAAPFETGSTADPVATDETEAVIEALGSDGIGYAIANQVVGSDDVAIISMHQTLPDNPAYPFSQPRNYVYQGEPTPAVAGFLAIATSDEGETTVEAARDAEAAASADLSGPAPTAETEDGALTATTDEDNLAIINDADGNLVAGPLAGAGGAVTALAFSPDGETLATGTNTGQVRYWGIDGEPKSDSFQAITGDDRAVESLSFVADDKLQVSGSQGRRGFWGLNGLTYGESAPGATSPVVAAGDADGESGFPWWWLLLPLLGLIGLGWLFARKGKQKTLPEPIRQTSPTATVPPPETDLADDREVSTRAHTVISTDRVTDDSRVVASPPDAPEVPTVGMPVASAPQIDTPVPNVPLVESTDLESPDLEGTNLDLMTPAAGLGAAAVGGAAIGGIVMSGMDSDVEDDDDDLTSDVWDDNIDLSLDEPTDEPTDEPVIAAASAAPPDVTSDEVAPVDVDVAAVAPISEPTLDSIEPTRDTIIAETESIPDIEPTRETIIGDSAVIFGEAAAVSDTAETADSSPVVASGGPGNDSTSFENDVAPTVDLPVTTAPAPAAPTTPQYVAAAGVAASAVTIGMSDASESSPDSGEGFSAASADAAEAAAPVQPSAPTLSRETLATVDEPLSDLPDGYGESRIVLLPRDPQWAYSYWDVSNEHKEALRQQGGQRLMLRLYDVTDIDQARQAPHSMQQFDCHEMARSWYLEIPVSDRDYTVEIGYLTGDERWLVLAKSAPVRIPPVYPSDWINDQFITINWNESLAGRTFIDLGRPGSAADAAVSDLPKIYDDLFKLTEGQEAMRVAGSLFGSMHQVAPGALSPSGNVSGLTALTNVPGLNVSGLNVSGLNVSGLGSGGAEFPARPRNFWLVADAELIVYGATEPDATLTVGDRVIPLNPDGTFRFHVAFPDGQIDYPIHAVAVDGEQSRSIHMHFERGTPERNTNTKEDAQDEWF